MNEDDESEEHHSMQEEYCEEDHSKKHERMEASTAPPSSSPVLAQKIYSALQEDILSLSEEAEKNLLPPFTSFCMSEDDNMQHLVHSMRRQCPVLCREENRESLVFQLLSMLDSK